MSKKVEPYIYRRNNGTLRVRIPDGEGGERSLGTFPDTPNGLADARTKRDEALAEYNVQKENVDAQVKDTEQLNTRTVEATVEGIHTIEELLDYCQVNPDEWKPYRSLVNKWPVGAKSKTGDMSWKDGVASGELHYGELTVTPLIQVKVWLTRVKPIALFPTIQPVQVNATYQPPPKPNTSGIGRALIFCDIHAGYTKDTRSAHLTPFHDRAALDLLIQIAEHTQPDRIDGLGDSLDLAEWSDRFVRLPEFYDTTQPAIEEMHWHLKQLRASSPQSIITLYCGNHENRIERAQIANLRASYDLRPADEIELPPPLSPQRLLGLAALGIEWVADYPDGSGWLNDRLQISHGNTAVAETARKIANASQFCQIYAHTHRRERFGRVVQARAGSFVVEAVNPGCLCYTDYRIPGHTRGQHWQQGIAVVDYETDGTAYNVNLIPIEHGKAMFDGKLFTARDRVEDLRRDIPHWNW